MVEQKISLDFAKNGVQKTVHARQGENASRDILISLTANGEPVDVSEYTMKVIYPDTTHTLLEAGNPVRVTIPQEMCREVGENVCEVQIAEDSAEGAILYSPQFRVLVEGTILGASGSSEPIGDPTVYQPLIAGLEPYPSSTLGANAKVPVYDPAQNGTKLADPAVLQPDVTELEERLDDVEDAVDDKVDKVSGKGLSTNDYTTAEKNKLSGIESGAEVNALTDVVDSNGDSLVTNRVAHIPASSPDVVDIWAQGGALAYTFAEILEMAQSKALLFNGYTVLRVRETAQMPASLEIYYVGPDPYDLSRPVLRCSTYSDQSTRTDDSIIGGWSEQDYTYAEKTKLGNLPSNAESVTNKVTSLSAQSTDTEYPSAKCVYDLIAGVDTLLGTGVIS